MQCNVRSWVNLYISHNRLWRELVKVNISVHLSYLSSLYTFEFIEVLNWGVLEYIVSAQQKSHPQNASCIKFRGEIQGVDRREKSSTCFIVNKIDWFFLKHFRVFKAKILNVNLTAPYKTVNRVILFNYVFIQRFLASKM